MATPPATRTSHPLRYVAGIVLVVAWGWLARRGDLRPHPELWIPVAAATAAFAWVAVRRRFDRRALWTFAILFRLAVAFGDPMFSDDVWRFWWDGRLQWQGVHPYAHAPADPALESFRDADWARINHPEVATIYPPGAQAAFALVAGVGRHPWAFKLFAAAADLAVLAWLASFVRRRRAPSWILWAYGWNPFVIAETAGTGHWEPLGAWLLCVAASRAATASRRGLASPAAWAAAVLMKLWPLVALPALARRWGVRRTVAASAFVVLGFVPYAAWGPATGSGLGTYVRAWEHNASVYAVTEAAFEAVWPVEAAKRAVERVQSFGPDVPALWDAAYRAVWPREAARLSLAALGACLLLLWAKRGPPDPVAAVRDAVLILLVLSPTVHPWYALWLLPAALATGRPSVLVWTAALFGTYLFPGEVPVLYRVFEYGAFATAWVLDSRRAVRSPPSADC